MGDEQQIGGRQGADWHEPRARPGVTLPSPGRLAPAAVLALVAIGYLGGWFSLIDSRLLEGRFRLNSRPASGDLVIVSIDPHSLQMLDVWPWPRGYHATVLDNLLAAGARRVAFDIDFSSRSIPGEDAELAAALERAGRRAILPVFVQHDTAGGTTSATQPLTTFRRHVTLASINVLPDTDGLVRRYRVHQMAGGRRLPTLAAALTDGASAAPGEFLVDFGIRVSSIPRISYVDILTGNFDPTALRDKVVLIGATAVELGDQVAVPVHAAVPGVMLQGLAFESLHQRRALVATGSWPALGLALLVAVLLGPGIVHHAWRAGLSWLGLGVTGLWCGAWGLQLGGALIMDLSPALLTLVGLYATALMRRTDLQAVRLLVQGRTLHGKEILIQRVMESSFDAIVTISPDGNVKSCNAAASQMFRYPAAVLIGMPLDRLLAAGAPDPGTSRPGRPAETIGRRRDGSTFPLEIVISEITTEMQRIHVALLRDITERREQQAALQHQAFHDALTDLPNRFLLQQRMEENLETAGRTNTPVAFLILDLDRFKEVNDTLGHHIGDQLLRQIANRLQEPLRPGDTIARLGGDEFAVLLPDADLPTAIRLARTFLEILDRPFTIQGFSLQIGASIGIALFPDHGRDAYILLQRADVAMYLAKRDKSGVSVYDVCKDDHSLRQLTLTGELKEAIELNNFLLCYQPKLSCADDQPAGMEALVRWQHPRHGLLSPDEFIGLAENTGLIRPLTYWVLNTALRQYASWRKEGVDIPIAINLSAQSLRERDLPGRLRDLLDTWGLMPEHLILEITESVLMDDPERSMEIVTALHDLGIAISIDDFGTGYSSLAYLKRLPAREIKIDRSFVSDMDDNPDDIVIVRSTVELAHNLGLRVVAEGIETIGVWERLKEMGCDIGQGYLFSRPVVADEFLAWYHRARDGQPIESRPAMTLVQPRG